MKKCLVLFVFVLVAKFSFAQAHQYDFSKVSLNLSMMQIRINIKDTFMLHEKFAMPPSCIYGSPNEPFKTKHEADSIIALIHYMQKINMEENKNYKPQLTK